MKSLAIALLLIAPALAQTHGELKSKVLAISKLDDKAALTKLRALAKELATPKPAPATTWNRRVDTDEFTKRTTKQTTLRLTGVQAALALGCQTGDKLRTILMLPQLPHNSDSSLFGRDGVNVHVLGEEKPTRCEIIHTGSTGLLGIHMCAMDGRLLKALKKGKVVRVSYRTILGEHVSFKINPKGLEAELKWLSAKESK